MAVTGAFWPVSDGAERVELTCISKVGAALEEQGRHRRARARADRELRRS